MGVTAPVAICLAGGWPPTPSNLKGLDAWIRSEKPAGQPWQWFNPLNTTDRWHASGIAPYGPGISIYPDPATGAMANARTIKGLDGMAGWPGIEDSLKRGRLGKDFFAGAAGLLSPPGGSAWGSNPATVESILHNPNPSPLGGTTNARLDVAGIGGSGSIIGLGLGSKAASGFWAPILNAFRGAMRVVEVGAGGAIMGSGLVVMVAAASGVAEGTADAVVRSKTRGLVSKPSSKLTPEEVQARHEARLAATTKEQEKRRVGASSEGIIERYFRQERAAGLAEERSRKETKRQLQRMKSREDWRLSTQASLKSKETEERRSRLEDKLHFESERRRRARISSSRTVRSPSGKTAVKLVTKKTPPKKKVSK